MGDQLGIRAPAVRGVLVDIDNRLGGLRQQRGCEPRQECSPRKHGCQNIRAGIIVARGMRTLRVRCGALLLLAAGVGAWAAGDTYTAAERRHWAFAPRSHPAVPSFTSRADLQWVSNPIDAFVLAELRKHGLKPAPAAGRQTLIRRLYFDLTGLPPSPEDVERFVSDPSPEAWPRLVDRLLDSPEYAE